MSVLPTIDEVARLCGVSKGTVSKAMNARKRLVADSTRAEILKVAESIGFKPSWRARALATRRSQMIAVLHSSENNAVPRTVYWDFVDRLDALLSERGYTIVFIHARNSQSHLEQMLGDGRFDGVIGLGTLDPAALAFARQKRLPAVLVNVDGDESWPRILPDDIGGTRLGLEHLWSLGHRRIAFRCSVRLDHPAWTDRVGTYRDFMVEHGVAPYEPYIGEGDATVAWLLALSAHQRPTAILDFAHWSAVGLLRALWSAGLQVPRDVSVMTYNDAYPTAETIPPLTTIALPSLAMADHAAKLILDRINGTAAEPQTIRLAEALVVRDSTGPA